MVALPLVTHRIDRTLASGTDVASVFVVKDDGVVGGAWLIE
jgi:hypothetical protein